MSEELPSHLGEHRRLREATRYTATITRTILEGWFEFHSVVDFGCGTGNWLKCFSANSDRTIIGLEMEALREEDIEIDRHLILHANLGSSIDLRRKFDLALCLEVAEHIDPSRASTVVENCVRHSDVVLFSAALPGQRGLHHVNEQLPAYWSALFEKHDFLVLDRIRPLIWDDANIPIWYRQNLLLFVHRASPCCATIESRSKTSRTEHPLAIAHPEYLAAFSHRIDQLVGATEELWNGVDRLRRRLDQNGVTLDRLTVELEQSRRAEAQSAQYLAEARLHVATIENSTMWRILLAVRARARHIPSPVRRFVRKALIAFNHLRRPAAGLRSTAEAPDAGAGSAMVVPPKPSRKGPFIVFVSGESQTPGHEYRVARYMRAAAAIGSTTHWFALDDHESHRSLLRGADIVILWRVPNSPAASAIIKIAREVSARVLFDVDDLIFRPEFATIKLIDGIRSQHLSESNTSKLYTRFREVLDQVDACFCSTDELADHIRGLGKVAYVLPNGFDYHAFAVSRHAARQWRATRQDQFIRIGYASGTLTHQSDFAIAADAIARVLREHADCRLVLFKRPGFEETTLNVEEFPCFLPVMSQIEWRNVVPLQELPRELARFDINVAPLEVGNVYCEAKSQLKYFEAALVNVCTVASPTGPMARAIAHDATGLLATASDDWYACLSDLVEKPDRRNKLARAAFLNVLGGFGPDQQQDRLLHALIELEDGPRGARSLQSRLLRDRQPAAIAPRIPPAEVLFSSDALRVSEATVVVPLYNYAEYLIEALDSVRRQTLSALDLIVIDDHSTDNSAELAVNWMRDHATRFNRAMVLRNLANSGLALTRNAGFDAAETAFVLPLDADNRLLPECCEHSLETLRQSAAGFAYPAIQQFGEANWRIGVEEFLPSRFIGGNFVDAMALVAKWAWLNVGGYADVKFGWEDYDFWCRCMERGIGGVRIPEVLAEYRVHGASMLRTQTDVARNKEKVIAALEQNHPWLRIVRPPEA